LTVNSIILKQQKPTDKSYHSSANSINQAFKHSINQSSNQSINQSNKSNQSNQSNQSNIQINQITKPINQSNQSINQTHQHTYQSKLIYRSTNYPTIRLTSQTTYQTIRHHINPSINGPTDKWPKIWL